MSLLILFLFILVLSFVTVLVLTRPTKEELTFSARLEKISHELRTGSDPDDILKRESYSDLPWLNELLSRLEPTANLKRLIAQAGSRWTVGRLVIGSLLVFFLVMWCGRPWVPNMLLLAVVACAAMTAPYFYLRFQRASRFRKFSSLLPDTMDLLARALKVGHSISSAVEMVSTEIADPVGPEFRRLFEEMNFGLPMREAMLNLVARVPLDDVRFLVTAILVQKETGGNLIEVLEKTTFVLRDRIRVQGQVRIYTAQGRLTGWVLCILPFVTFGGVMLLNPKYAATLLGDPLGQKLVLAAMCMMVIGVWVIRRIVEIKV